MTRRNSSGFWAAVTLTFAIVAVPASADDACPTVPAMNPFAANANLLDLQETAPAAAAAAPVKEGPSGDRPLAHVWVLDHSGSMYPGYKAKESRSGVPYYVEGAEFRDFVANGVGANFRDGKDSAAVVAFNEYAYGWNGSNAATIDNGSGPAFSSLKVNTRSELGERLRTLPPPPYGTPIMGFPVPAGGAQDCGIAGAATNCSKMLEGLDAARTLLDSAGGEGIIWLVTDNIYEPGTGGSDLAAAELDQNRKFYEALRDTTAFRVVVAYPIVRGSSGAWLKTTSLFVYGIYYDRDGSRRTPVAEVRRLLGDGAPGVLLSEPMTKMMAGYSTPSSPSPGKPFRLKPLDQDVVRISVTGDVTQLPGKKEMGQPVKLAAKLRVQNVLDHRLIKSVTFRVKNGKWTAYEPVRQGRVEAGAPMPAIHTICPNTFKAVEKTVTDIKPGESRDIDVELEMPPVDYKIHSASDLFKIAFNDQVIMGGMLQAELLKVESETSIPPANFAGTYGAASLPDVFRNPKSVNYTGQFVGKTKKIGNPGTVAMLVALVGIVAAVMLFLFGGFLLTSVSRRLVIDGQDRGAVSIPRLRSTALMHNGTTVAKASLGLGGAISAAGVGGHKVARNGPSTWTISKEGSQSIRLELKTTKR
jgi:hypothetical protein